jgi:peptidoglycan hydrolase CwlO-like protein
MLNGNLVRTVVGGLILLGVGGGVSAVVLTQVNAQALKDQKEACEEKHNRVKDLPVEVAVLANEVGNLADKQGETNERLDKLLDKLEAK